MARETGPFFWLLFALDVWIIMVRVRFARVFFGGVIMAEKPVDKLDTMQRQLLILALNDKRRSIERLAKARPQYVEMFNSDLAVIAKLLDFATRW